MRLLTREQSQNVDRVAEPEYNVKNEQLLESAGSAVAEETHLLIKDKKRKILILVGPGHNGADGMVAARILRRKGFSSVSCTFVEEKTKHSILWELQFAKAKNSGVKFESPTSSRLKLLLSECDVIIDAIFGTGLARPLAKETQELIQFLNTRKQIVIAVDIPTGLDVNTGWPLGVAVRANLTVTFGLAKPGLYMARGPHYAGKIKIHRLSFPEELLKKYSGTYYAFGAKAASRLLPKRDMISHKGDHGTVVAISGSSEFPGAGLLVANAAGRVGAGYVILSSFAGIFPQFLQIPEVIFRSFEKLKLNEFKKSTVFIVGPGLGVSEKTKEIILELKKRKFSNVVIDADAITVCVNEKLWPLPQSWILTPHAGELGRILEQTPEKLSKDRFQSALLASQKCGCIVLFKGYRTVVASRGRAFVILSGNAALAKAGAGDVLAGFIGGLLAQGNSALTAACLGAYIHGRLADDWLKEGKDILSLLPSDLAMSVPTLLKAIREE